MLRKRELGLVLCAGAVVVLINTRNVRGADEAGTNAAGTFRKYCFQCHGNGAAMAGVSLQQLIAKASVGENSQMWEKVAAALEQNRMPPKGLPQPADAERAHAASWIRSELATFARKNAGDPGRVTVRRLTSGEYDYAIQDLTGFDLDTGIDATTDSVGGEGFTNFGDVQFMQDATLERYLAAAKNVAEHAVIGAGPLEFYQDPGKSGFEMSAIARIKDIYNRNGFRTVSGEGGVPFGLEKYGKAFYVAWRYQHRKALGEADATLDQLAAKEGISPRFAKHIWGVMNRPSLAYPSSEVVARWHKLPAPGVDLKASADAARAACTEIQKYTTTWPSWLFARGDVAAGGAGDESPLVFSDASLRVEAKHHFVFLRGGRGGGAGRGAPPPGPAKIFLNVAQVNPAATGKPSIVWRNPTISFREGGRGRGQTPTAQPAAGNGAAAAAEKDQNAQDGAGQNPLRRLPPGGPRLPLRTVVSEETAKRLGFGKSIDSVSVGPDDFASDSSVWFEVPLPQGITVFDIQVDAEMGADRDQVYRITVTDREDGGARGIPTRTLLGDPQSNGYRTFKSGVMEFASLLPPNSHNEPTPADKDPIPQPFDSTYNVPEHDEFDTRVKYIRDDHFVYQTMLSDADRIRVDQAWNDLYASFEYHDNYLDLIAKHYKLDLKGKHISDLDKTQIASLPAEPAKYILPLRLDYEKAQAAQAASRPRHLEDCLKFASLAWRRPLSEREKQSLRAFYDKTVTADSDHRKAIRAVLTRILVSPAFLYRVEQPVDAAAVKPLNDWEMASRLSFFLWASIPDEELRRAAGAGELSNPQQLERQVKRMLADPKARRLATEFFGQWLGFYHFDQFRGVDTGRFPEFTDEVKSSMYDEAISFFEHIIRKDRPVREILAADYDFLNKPLAKYYSVNKDIKSTGPVELVENATTFQRGGLLRLGAVLTATSAPLRTSPVKRGDWVLRRILGTAVPPPPADAGSIPADDKLFGGLSVREKLELHKRNATCANCHLRIDPLGFPLERYDSTGRWREKYTDGKPIWDTGTFGDKSEVAGVQGLLDYLKTKDEQVRRTLSSKLLGYALGRTVQVSDQPLIDKMVAAGPDSTMTQLAAEIVTSRQFRNRLGREDGGTAVAANTDPKQSEKVGDRR